MKRNSASKEVTLFGIWCLDKHTLRDGTYRGDWLRNGRAVLAFTSKRHATIFAKEEYGFDSFTDAKRKGWVDVRVFGKGSNLQP